MIHYLTYNPHSIKIPQKFPRAALRPPASVLRRPTFVLRYGNSYVA